MPEEIVELFDGLKEDVLFLYLNWNRFNQLFAHSDERITLLRDTGKHFFGWIQNISVRAMISTSMRLLDRDTSWGHKTVSFSSLIKSIENNKQILKWRIP